MGVRLMKGGEFIVDFLIREEVPYVFGVCGHGNVGLLDAMYDRADELPLISPRHEQAAGHMADAYFRVAHKPAATLASIGPGSVNMLMPLANALSDSSAILSLTASAPTVQANRSPFQEIARHNQSDFAQSIRSFVKRGYQPQRIENLPLVMRQALTLTTQGRPGPVNVDIPFDLFQESADLVYEPAQSASIQTRVGAAPSVVAKVADLLLAAERPLIYTGNGVVLSEAGPELTELVRRLQTPVVSLPNGMGALDMRSEYSLGFVGRNGSYPANEAARRCDVLLDLGARFDDRSASSWIPGYSWNIPPTKLIQVDIDAMEIGRNYPVELGVVADVKTFLAQLLMELDRRTITIRHEDWLGDIAEWRRRWDEHVRPKFDISSTPLRPEQVVKELRAVLPDDGILIPDVGAHHNWFMQFWEARQPGTFLNSYGFGAMGFSVCGVLGAKLAAKDRPCISVCGDGGFTMTPYVLATAVEYDIPAIWVVWNNFGWVSIRDIQVGMFEGREIGTLFHRDGERYNPDFALMAKSYGVDAITVRHPDELGPALEHALALGKPCLIDVHVDGEIRPPSTGAWQLPPTPYREPSFGERYRPE
ncbi:thiamine pyrophosphate-binding protein [Pikeienuella piscinae]|uniref:Thiamine pyrophosphate-binding protein n=2 Tax=Pikeienuella piscinae TaxID=2748098 RepID=A0A7M3T778_9RHOB|nr:thiamine pyrophosphate-binding protein [Pikeienuella piscinae]